MWGPFSGIVADGPAIGLPRSSTPSDQWRRQVGVVVADGSQGGGIAIAVAALRSDLAGAVIDVPGLCLIERAVGWAAVKPYPEIARYLAIHRDLVEQSMRTLRYFDGAVLAPRATAPALFSVGLMDQVCPPSGVFAAFNRWVSHDKEIVVYPYNGHEGGGSEHDRRKLDWVAARFTDRRIDGAAATST